MSEYRKHAAVLVDGMKDNVDFVRATMEREYADQPPLCTDTSDDHAVVIGRNGAAWAEGRTDDEIVQQCGTRAACFMRADHLGLVLQRAHAEGKFGTTAAAAAYNNLPEGAPPGAFAKHVVENATEEAIADFITKVKKTVQESGRGGAVTAEEAGASATASETTTDGDTAGGASDAAKPILKSFPETPPHTIAPVVTSVAPFHDGMARREGPLVPVGEPANEPTDAGHGGSGDRGSGYAEWPAAGPTYPEAPVGQRGHPDETRVCVPDYVIRHVMRWTHLINAADMDRSKVNYERRGSTTVVKGRTMRRPVFDPIRRMHTWDQVRVPSIGTWRMPCSYATGAPPRVYCRMFGTYFPNVSHSIVSGLAIFEDLLSYSVMPYCVIQLGPSETALVDVAPDTNRLNIAPYVVFVRLPPGIKGTTLQVLKDTSACSRCGKRALVPCPHDCKVGRYCSETCLELHANRHQRWCKPGRRFVPDAGFAIPMAEADYL